MSTSFAGDVADSKAAMRRRLLAARRSRQGRDGAAIRDVVLAWEPVQRAHTIALYASIGTEPDTRPLIEALHERGVAVLLPVVLPDLDLDWALFTPGGLGAAQNSQALGNLEEPTGARLGVEAVRTADLVLVPGLAVSSRGDRLGRGGGCYDRALARVDPGTPVAVVLHPDEVGLDVPTQPHDRRVGHAVTARGVTSLGSGGGCPHPPPRPPPD